MSRNGCCGTYSYDKLSVDDDANIIVMADFFRKLGDILYYKNVYWASIVRSLHI